MTAQISLNRRALLASAALAAFAGVAGCSRGVTAANLRGQAPVANTQYGPVRGLVEDAILIFKGVRYGADTATTRFAAPAAPEPWTEVRDATAYGASTPQTPTGDGGGLFLSWRPDPVPPYSEDCLFLNVWTPALRDGGKRPVMVWFHGGGFASGNGSSRAYEGARLSTRGDVVVVTVNHRLNVFGFLHLADYGAEFADSGNAGVLDLVHALQWVRDNAEEFGGDPANVMIFGESGGGAKVSTLMAMDAAKGLFHRAAVESGAMLMVSEADEAKAATDRLLAKLHLTADTIAQIKTLPVDTIRAALPDTGAGAGPVVDGRNLTRHPFAPDGPPQSLDVPLLIGINRTESTLLGGNGHPELFELTWATLPAAITAAYPSMNAAQLIADYRRINPDYSPSDLYFAATTDGRFLRGHAAEAERKAAQGGAPAYFYLFNWSTPVMGGRWRSPHAVEIGFVFDNVAKSESMSGIGEEQQQLADIMSETWLAFAKTGDPNNPKLPHWEPYNAQTRPGMVIDLTPELVNDPHGAERKLFDALPLGPRG